MVCIKKHPEFIAYDKCQALPEYVTGANLTAFVVHALVVVVVVHAVAVVVVVVLLL